MVIEGIQSNSAPQDNDEEYLCFRKPCAHNRVKDCVDMFIAVGRPNSYEILQAQLAETKKLSLINNAVNGLYFAQAGTLVKYLGSDTARLLGVGSLSFDLALRHPHLKNTTDDVLKSKIKDLLKSDEYSTITKLLRTKHARNVRYQRNKLIHGDFFDWDEVEKCFSEIGPTSDELFKCYADIFSKKCRKMIIKNNRLAKETAKLKAEKKKCKDQKKDAGVDGNKSAPAEKKIKTKPSKFFLKRLKRMV